MSKLQPGGPERSEIQSGRGKQDDAETFSERKQFCHAILRRKGFSIGFSDSRNKGIKIDVDRLHRFHLEKRDVLTLEFNFCS